MIKEFEPITEGIRSVIKEWEPRLLALKNDVLTKRKNIQNRTIKQIVGHLIDSASNNTHRIVHMQYQPSPLIFPNYATNGNNDRWIAIQNYQDEDWKDMMMMWKYANLHIIHVIRNVDATKLDHTWQYSDNKVVSLKDGIIDYLRHLELHMQEIEELINQG